MSDYAEIADALRYTASAISDHKLEVLSARTLNDGATAIEELTAQVRDKDYLIQQQVDEIERLQRDVKKQQEKMIELAKKLPKRGKMVEVVRCKDCVYYHKAHVKLDDGTELDYDSDVVKEYQQKRKESGDPFWEMVCADLGMNVCGRCERDNNQGYAEDKAVFRSETDFCSKARAKMEVQDA